MKQSLSVPAETKKIRKIGWHQIFHLEEVASRPLNDSHKIAVICLTLVLTACADSMPISSNPTSRSNATPLTIMWEKGYVLEEDEAIQKAVRAWQHQSGIKTKLSFYNPEEIAPTTLRSSQAGMPPDILFAAKSRYPISDWQGKLADVTDIIEPRKQTYSADALLSARLYGKRDPRYYAIPIGQGTTLIYYWKDLLQQAGYRPEDIPSDWDGFWTFWKTVQKQLRKQGQKVYGLGLPLSNGGVDVYYIFEHILAAYDVTVLDAEGQLQVDRPEVRQGIIRALDWYLQHYRDGSIPPGAPKWLDPDNNRALLDRTVLMTPNPTLSIPAAVYHDPEAYFKRLGTIEFPKKPSGQPMTHLIMQRQAIIFSDASHAADAKAFLAYLTQPPLLNKYLKSSFGRTLPSTPQLKQDPFWLNPADPHISTASTMIATGQTRPYPIVLNPAYGVFLEENVWGKVLHQMAVEKLPAETAADRAIARMKEIFAQHP
jgi:multiple sugar transport system substrate-binding protein